jgi:hypothetical protein
MMAENRIEERHLHWRRSIEAIRDNQKRPIVIRALAVEVYIGNWIGILECQNHRIRIGPRWSQFRRPAATSAVRLRDKAWVKKLPTSTRSEVFLAQKLRRSNVRGPLTRQTGVDAKDPGHSVPNHAHVGLAPIIASPRRHSRKC